MLSDREVVTHMIDMLVRIEEDANYVRNHPDDMNLEARMSRTASAAIRMRGYLANRMELERKLEYFEAKLMEK